MAVGAKAQFYVGGTTTPLTTYTDADASTPHDTASLVTDADGQWPSIFVPYGSFDYRILDNDNSLIATAKNVPNPAPIDPTTTDPNAIMQTGDMIFSPAAVARSGFVRCNGNTIGSGASPATERANDDTETLFTWLWNNLANDQAAVSGGRGGTAAADWSTNKTIAIPDLRGSSPFGLDDMGASNASRLNSVPFINGNTETGGSVVGANTVTLLEANLPAHIHGVGTLETGSHGTHSHSISGTATSAGGHSHGVTDPVHNHTIQDYRTAASVQAFSSGGSVSVVTTNSLDSFSSVATATGISINNGGTHSHTVSGSASSNGAHSHTVSGATASAGSDAPTTIVSRSILGTWLLKL